MPHFNILKALYVYSSEDSNACGDGQVFKVTVCETGLPLFDRVVYCGIIKV